MKQRYLLAWIFLGLVALVSTKSASAGIDPMEHAYLNGGIGQLHVDSICMVQHSKYFDVAYNSRLIKPYKVQNAVSFKINEAANVTLSSAFSASLTVRIYRTFHGSIVDSVDKTLQINYDGTTSYQQIATFRFSDAYRVEVKILSRTTNVSWDVWPALQLDNSLQAFPQYTFSCTADAVQAISGAALDSMTTADELAVSWSNIIGADEYDLEWTYIDSAALASGLYGAPSSPNPTLIFENNASRVTIVTNSYRIPLLYDNKGTLFYRVRSVQVQDNGGRSEAHWSSDYTGGFGRFYFYGHERALNWQATTSFAEEGKRKSVVQYFDGSLRGRQTVTKDNTTDTTIVAETFYDYQGRPVIQVLPTPSLSTVIQYAHNFNRNMNGTPYDKPDFDSLANPENYCSMAATAMQPTTSGSSRYYSPNNPDYNNGINQYIPDAGGFPFTEVQYTQDNTGRMVKQSGVGAYHRLGSGHETVYYYGLPDQDELDALFGTEVGNHTHYAKTVVRDANGQYSISYADMHGRTIATALAGAAPSSLQSLNSRRDSVVTERLVTPETNISKDLVMESQKSLVVTKAGTFHFDYRLDPDSIRIKGCDSVAVCYDCLYDLNISISDDCNNNKLPGHKTFDTTLHNFTLNQIDTLCGDTVKGIHLVFDLSLEEGNYEITKSLSVSQYALAYYRDSIYMRHNTCKTLDDFINEQRAILAIKLPCTATCTSCQDSLGTWSTYRNRFMIRNGIIPADSAGYRSMALAAFQQDSAACAALCLNGPTEYDELRDAMLSDLTPPSGQYADLSTSGDPYSIFFSHSHLPTINAKYTLPTGYLNEAHAPDQVFDEAVGIMVSPQQLSKEAFSQKFKRSWAEALLPYHPEACKLDYYKNYLLPSVQWDLAFQAVETYSEAVSKGFLNPTNHSGYPFSGSSTNYDPIVNVTYNSAAYRDSLDLKITDYNGGINLWIFATAMAKCTNQGSSCLSGYSSSSTPFDVTTMCTGDLDQAWKIFRQFYLIYKRRLINKQLNALCSTPTVATLVSAGHAPHFGDPTELFSAYGVTIPTSSSAGTTQVTTSMSSTYAANCAAYAKQWWLQLKPCNNYTYNATDSAVIIPRLIEVCKEGSDSRHLLGASTVHPGSTYAYTSFEAVIKDYNLTHGIPYDSACNAYLITSPLPYNQVSAYSNITLITKPDSCTCDKIGAMYTKYQAGKLTAETFSHYLERVYHTVISQGALDTLRATCAGTLTCNFLNTPIILPPVLQCGVDSVCIGCSAIDTLWTHFQMEFPGTLPSIEMNDTVQLKRNRLFANYMNHHTGFSYSASDYLMFMENCGKIDLRKNRCDSLRRAAKDYANTSSLPCAEFEAFSADFTTYYNSTFSTSLSFAQIDSIYQRCGYNLSDCKLFQPPSLELCGKVDPVFGPIDTTELSHCMDSAFFAISIGTELFLGYQDSLRHVFDSSYRTHCMQAYKFESFTVTYTKAEYHYTLYYYDQGGNLVKTVPPEGVVTSFRQSWYDSVAVARANNTNLPAPHTLVTQYRYNTLNQVMAQASPDGGQSNFWYDRLGRLVISQNAKQKALSSSELNRAYSYTQYDYLGRITEVGQIINASTTAMTDAISRDPSTLDSWLTASASGKEQITFTVYDLPYPGFTPTTFVQRNLRNRVSYSSFSLGANPAQFNSATYYTYDVHGNVDTLLQDYGSSSVTALKNLMNENGNRFKRIIYRYDLVSGKVNHVAYQPGIADQFYHRYSYDAENRLTQVETSYDSVHWEKDARYQYYKHGPLARTVLGDQMVQGLDYAYSLQGWLKGVNSTALSPDFDMGQDGKISEEHQYIARDAYSFDLHYFSGDYTSISGLEPLPNTATALGSYYRPLYNGNIGSMAVNIGHFNQPLLYNYQYDQLNRLVAMDAYQGLNSSTNTWGTLTNNQAYLERVSYDANGNILTYKRQGTASSFNMDDLGYSYNRDVQGRLINNQLNHVVDAVGSSAYAEDVDNQSNNNYSYDAIGNLISDNAEHISSIQWTVYGKIGRIVKTSDPAGVATIDYTYDASGNRVSKTVTKTDNTVATTWYVRDASGNVMSTYGGAGTTSGALSAYTLVLQEQHIYGSSRLGLLGRNVNMKAAFSYKDSSYITFTRGWKNYELSNHLGNVLVTVSDKKIGHDGGSGFFDYYEADVVTANDYYPFGMMMPGREFNSDQMSNSFNGQLKSSEVGKNHYTALYWEYSSPTVRRWNMDPKPNISISPYVGFPFLVRFKSRILFVFC
jgi:YD repeat-containing protein